MPTPSTDHPRRRQRRAASVALFFAAVAVYALCAWERLPQPSQHLHFLDLAESFLAGRLDTDTPSTSCRRSKAPAGEPRGRNDFICRHAYKEDGSWEGWNDWATIHDVVLKDGTALSGVWRFGDTKGSDRHRFETLDGDVYIVDKSKDLRRGCDPKRRHAACHTKRHFVSFPPAPAVLMLPFAAVWHYRVNDVIWTILFAAAGLVALFSLLEHLSAKEANRRSLRDNLLITALVGFGTSLFFSSVRGEVWFTALVMGFFFHVLYVRFALDARRPMLAGLMLAIGMATRTPIAFAAAFMAVELLRVPDWRGRIIRGLWFSLPILAVGGLLMAYNQARFGDLFEFGHGYLQDGQRPSIRKHGLFSAWFLNGNMAAAFANLPLFIGEAPYVKITRHGLSIFAATPALLWALWPKRCNPHMAAALAALVAVALPALFYQNTGWAQFSYRFSIDYLPYLAVLLACGDRPLGRGFWALTAASVIIATFGAITFGRFDEFYFG